MVFEYSFTIHLLPSYNIMALPRRLFFLLSLCICFSLCSSLRVPINLLHNNNDNSTVIDTNNLSTDELIQKLMNLTITKHGGVKLWNEQNYQNLPPWAPPQWFYYIFPPEIREIMRHYIYQTPPEWLQYSQPNYCYYYCTPNQPGNQYQQPGNGYQQPGYGRQQPGNGRQQPGNGYQQPRNGRQQPGTGYQQPGYGRQQPGNGYQQPGNGYQQPRNGRQQPGNGYQQPGNGRQQPGNGYQQPGNGRQQPGTGYQQPGNGYQQPGSGCAPTSTRVYDSCSNNGNNQGGYNSGNYQTSYSCATTSEGCCQAAASVSNDCANADPLINFLKFFCCRGQGR